jgi:hypothetical protein
MRQISAIVGLVFAITLAVVVGREMSSEAMAVVIGIVCGVAAGIPASLFMMLALSRRERKQATETQQQAAPGNYPPVVVIQGGESQPQRRSLQAGYWPTAPPGPTANRQFHIVGGKDLIVDGEWSRQQ